jgi:hypothetical protein
MARFYVVYAPEKTRDTELRRLVRVFEVGCQSDHRWDDEPRAPLRKRQTGTRPALFARFTTDAGRSRNDAWDGMTCGWTVCYYRLCIFTYIQPDRTSHTRGHLGCDDGAGLCRRVTSRLCTRLQNTFTLGTPARGHGTVIGEGCSIAAPLLAMRALGQGCDELS